MSESNTKPTITILKRFLDETGLSTLWTNITTVINTVKNELQENINILASSVNQNTNDIETNSNNIDAINNSLDNYRGYPIETLSGTTHTISPNTYYKLKPTDTTIQTINFASTSNSNITNEYVIEIDCTSSSPTISFPINVKWANENSIDVSTGKKYIISIINNCGVFGEY